MRTLFALLAFSIASHAADGKKPELTIDNIMRGPGLTGYEPSGVRWSPNSQRVYFQWKQWNDPRDQPFDTYVVNREGSGLRKLSEEEAKDAPPVNGSRSLDGKWTVFTSAGDVTRGGVAGKAPCTFGTPLGCAEPWWQVKQVMAAPGFPR